MHAAARRHEVATRYYTAEHRQHDDLYTRSRSPQIHVLHRRNHAAAAAACDDAMMKMRYSVE